MADEKGQRVTVYLTDVQRMRLEAIKEKRETDNLTRTMSWLVDDEWRRIENHATKEDRLHDIMEVQAVMQQQIAAILGLLELLQTEKWSQIAPPDGRIRIEFVMDDAQLERVIQARR